MVFDLDLGWREGDEWSIPLQAGSHYLAQYGDLDLAPEGVLAEDLLNVPGFLLRRRVIRNQVLAWREGERRFTLGHIQSVVGINERKQVVRLMVQVITGHRAEKGRKAPIRVGLSLCDRSVEPRLECVQRIALCEGVCGALIGGIKPIGCGGVIHRSTRDRVVERQPRHAILFDGHVSVEGMLAGGDRGRFRGGRGKRKRRSPCGRLTRALPARWAPNGSKRRGKGWPRGPGERGGPLLAPFLDDEHPRGTAMRFVSRTGVIFGRDRLDGRRRPASLGKLGEGMRPCDRAVKRG